MKKLSFIIGTLACLIALNSCCTSCLSCTKTGGIAIGGCENKKIATEKITHWVEEQVKVAGVSPVYDSKGAIIDYGTKDVIKTIKRPVTKTRKYEQCCGNCGSTYCPTPDCCGLVSNAILTRASGQGWTGEPHIGQIPTMKILAP